MDLLAAEFSAEALRLIAVVTGSDQIPNSAKAVSMPAKHVADVICPSKIPAPMASRALSRNRPPSTLSKAHPKRCELRASASEPQPQTGSGPSTTSMVASKNARETPSCSDQIEKPKQSNHCARPARPDRLTAHRTMDHRPSKSAFDHAKGRERVMRREGPRRCRGSSVIPVSYRVCAMLGANVSAEANAHSDA